MPRDALRDAADQDAPDTNATMASDDDEIS
jgi:hypothetical protein